MKRPDKTLGVLGGMGPAATAEFMRLMSELAPADFDQEHPETIVYSHTATPDRTTHILGRGPDPMPELRKGIDRLAEWGADVFVATCNTAHYFLDMIRDELPIPLIHIIEQTVIESKSISPRGAWLTSTLGTAKTGLYQKHSALMDYRFEYPTPEEQQVIHDITDMVKGGDVRRAGIMYGEVIAQLWERKKLPVVGACTELPIAYGYTGLDKKDFVSCLESLAKGTVRYLYGETKF